MMEKRERRRGAEERQGYARKDYGKGEGRGVLGEGNRKRKSEGKKNDR